MSSSPDISVEISKYPLTENYREKVDDFLYRLHRHAGLRIEVNALSTQVFGPADQVFAALQQEILTSFEAGQCPFVIKILAGNLYASELKDYAPATGQSA